jgi:hypothetical protein
MAKRWSFEEDYIICKFAYKYSYKAILNFEFDCLMLELKACGYPTRSKTAIIKRVYNYQYLFMGYSVSGIPEQMKSIAEAYRERIENPEHRELIQHYLGRTGNENDYNSLVGNSNFFEGNTPNTYSFVAVEPIAPSFRELLLSHLIKSGRSNADIYHASRISKDKFNHIINGRKGKKIPEIDNGVNASHRTVMQLCVGLKLKYDEAVNLMASAGYAFETKKYPDEIVLKYLKEQNHDIFSANIELYDLKAPRLF